MNGGPCGRFDVPDIYTSTIFAPIYAWIREKVECLPKQKCIPREQCPEVQRKYDLLERSNRRYKKQLKKEISKLLCDKKEQLFCCNMVEKTSEKEKKGKVLST